MDTRKVQKVGGGTYTVSLPKAWAESENVAAGDAVGLYTHIDGALVVQVREREDDEVERIPVRAAHDEPATLARTVRAAYAAGATEVVLDAPERFTDDHRRAVERATRDLTGTTVANESGPRITVRTLLDADEVSVRQSVRQLRFVALSMHRDATAALTGDADASDLTDRDDQADRLFALIDRHLARGLARLDEVDALGLTRPELFESWATARELERVADRAEDVATVARRTDEPVAASTADDLRDLARSARGVVENAVSVVVGDADVETAHHALDARDRVREDAATLDRRLFESAGVEYRLARVLDAVRRTAEHGGTVAELGLRAAVRRDELAAASGDRDESRDAEERRASTGADG